MNDLGKVLGDLYDLVAGRFDEEGGGMPVPKRVFLLASELPPGVFDARKIRDVDNRTFLLAAYLCLFSAIPSNEVLTQWASAIETLPPPQFQMRILSAIRNSAVGKERKVTIRGLDMIMVDALATQAPSPPAADQ